MTAQEEGHTGTVRIGPIFWGGTHGKSRQVPCIPNVTVPRKMILYKCPCRKDSAHREAFSLQCALSASSLFRLLLALEAFDIRSEVLVFSAVRCGECYIPMVFSIEALCL